MIRSTLSSLGSMVDPVECAMVFYGALTTTVVVLTMAA